MPVSSALHTYLLLLMTVFDSHLLMSADLSQQPKELHLA